MSAQPSCCRICSATVSIAVAIAIESADHVIPGEDKRVKSIVEKVNQFGLAPTNKPSPTTAITGRLREELTNKFTSEGKFSFIVSRG